MNTDRWRYECVDTFFDRYYDRLLTENMITGDEMYIKEYVDSNGEKQEITMFFYPLKKGKVIYLIPSKFINKLPLMVEKYEQVSFRNKGYRLPKINEDTGKVALRPMRIKPEKQMSFRDLVDSFAEARHENPIHNTLWKLIVLTSIMDRINVRVATPPEFGKDSKVNLINSLVGNVGMISNPTIAKLEYLLFNKLIFLNEVSGIGSTSKDDVEQFLLATADFNNKYVKRSRASKGSKEDYNISKLSVVIAYNDIEQYKNQDKYFDVLWTNAGAVNNRILPFLFNGKLKTDYNAVVDINEIVSENWDFYLRFLRTLLHYQENPNDDTKNYKLQSELDMSGNGRWEKNINTIKKWVSKYARDEGEYNDLINKLYDAHLEYLKMVGVKTSPLPTNLQPLESDETIEEEVKEDPSEIVIKYLKKFDRDGKGIDINILLRATQTEEDTINKMKLYGQIMEIKNGVVTLL
ncbi:hypothetical protein [uncultured Arcobacter sp.]|uniref:hypothetical protein n=1 Tax=uncultured Arcobacter sp. TaxID=165434 RepID=UPI0026169773|nr:hypothetical protein [uncultured Arcobacter sp.]